MKKPIHSAHDKFFKKALSNLTIAQEFFDTHLPPTFKKLVDLSTLSIEKGSFVDSALREHLSDMLYKVNIDNREGYIYILLEAQSTPDELMAFRVLEYSVQIMRRHLDKQAHNKKPETLPLVMPVVFYSGTRSADGFKRDIMDCFAQPDLARHYFMQPFTLISMTDTPDEDIMQGKLTAAIELIQKHITARDITLYIDELIKAGALRRLCHLDSDLLTSMLKYIAEKGQIKEPTKLVNKLIKHLPGEEKDMTTIAEHFKQEGMQQGMQQGMHQAKIDMAKNLLAQGIDVTTIAKASGMKTGDIENLKTQKH